MSHYNSPATSPYAPSSRNSYLRRSSSSSVTAATTNNNNTSSKQRTTAAMALFLVVLQFWKDHRGVLWEKVIRGPSERLLRLFQSLSIPALITNNDTAAPSSSRDVSSLQSSPSTQHHHRQRIQENQQYIQAVLDYWFGQYPPDVSQKMLWMIGASSVEHRQTVDAEIAVKFETLLLELANESNKNPTSQSQRWEEWVLDTNKLYGSRGKIAAIIVMDQFSRHIQRYHQERHHAPFPVAQSTLDQLALKTSELLMQHHSHEITCGMIPLPMYIFALMPYRHASTLETVQYVQNCVEQSAALHTQMEAMLGRFRKATNRRMAVLQDEARRTGKSQHAHNMDNGDTSHTTPDSHADASTPQNFTDEDILETFPFEADLSSAVNHPIHKTIVQFLADQGIHPSQSDVKAKSAAVIVSLSGGVDSMVIASVLAHLQRSRGYHHLHIIAVHIDYANRPESGAEADFVRRYCHNLDIDFQCRRIGEVTRGITARDDYERIARTIRYDSYREAVATARTVLSNHDQIIIGVMLGHHRGDLRENVLSNAHKGCGPLDLSGMTAVSVNDGIVVYRPLLPLEKSIVLDYAHKYGVPYFKDTTPHWSTRGKLRNKLLPLLEEIYGDGCMNNLSNLAVESDECRNLLQKSIIGPFMNAIVRKPMGIIMDTAPWKDQPFFFWKFVLRVALHSASLGMFSDKSVQEFLKRVKAPKLKNAWLQCRRDYGVYLQDDGKVFVFFPWSFPWNKEDHYNVSGNIEYDIDTMVGPWKVRAELFEGSTFQDATEVPTDWLAKRAVISMQDFMDGKIEYFVETPSVIDSDTGSRSPKPLVFCEFTKDNRPLAWKNCDLRIQSTLPLLGSDYSSNNDGKDAKEHDNQSSLVRVSLKLLN